ncbi:ADP-ribosylglycohydrolase family protein [Tannerella sp.]|uniref:ADP-ribosylglycohydrolase family protein n=1 Tax=Tannerella sp. TaxID=2382127 RepID=UPI003FA22B6E
MLGAIIGDIVGSRFEFNNTNQTNFKLFTPDCNFTDDTICTIAVADALLNGSDFGDTIHRWCRKYPYPTGGYGGSFARWVHSDIPKPYNSFGNGSAMRVSPCGWLSTRQEVLSHARQSAECTHNHPEGIKGAMCIADCIYHAHVGADKSEMVALVTKEYTYPLDMTCHEIRSINTFNETCQVTVPQAIVCFVESTDFENSIRLAVSIGGDSDTIAAITGSIAEAYYGIPENIEQKALSLLTPEMKEVITQFKQKYKKSITR